jgi:hypothetical protein
MNLLKGFLSLFFSLPTFPSIGDSILEYSERAETCSSSSMRVLSLFIHSVEISTSKAYHILLSISEVAQWKMHKDTLTNLFVTVIINT